MKQKKHNDKRLDINNMKNKRTASSAAYKRIKRATKDYQKSNYDNQTDNKDNNRNIDMSMGLGEEKKLKGKTDRKEEKPSSSPEAITTPSPPPPPPPTLSTVQPEVFDSYRYNAMSEMKESADMGPDNASKVFSHVEEKQQLDPSTISINDGVNKTDPKNSLNTNPDTTSFPAMANPTLEERDRNVMESKKDEDLEQQQQGIKSDTAQINRESEKQEHLGESVKFYDNDKKMEYDSNSLSNDNNIPFISGVKLWQAYNEAWIDAYSEFMKAWMSIFKIIC
jgi:hypothetical protein